MVNKSQQREDDRILHCTWSTDIPYLRLYHTLIKDNTHLSLGEAFATKTREQLDGQNSNSFKSFYEKAADRFNDASWIPNSLIILTENDAKSLSKTPWLVALNMYLTLHLLLFAQSM